MSRISLSTVFKHRDDVRYRLIDGEAVIIRQDAGEVLGLNDVGARVLDLIDAKTSVERLLATMEKEFEIDRRALEGDVYGFLQELIDAGIIEEAGSS